MHTILNIETATDICSVAISQGKTICWEVEANEPLAHASKITLLIDECVQKARVSLQELDAIAVSIGPGSYTALRIGLSTAKGIAYALRKPIITINSLKALAAGTRLEAGQPSAVYLPMIDARRMEVYLAAFDHRLAEITPPRAQVMDRHSLDNWLAHYPKIVLCGNGANKLRPLYNDERIVFGLTQSKARFLATLANQAYQSADFADLAYVEPLYGKPPNITTPKKVL